MGNIGKGFSILLLIILAASSLIIVESASAQSIPKPSVPEFTLKFIAKPYDVPPVINEKTGAILAPGYRDDNQTIIITIKNQPFNPGLNDTYHLFYYVRAKNHSDSNWTETYPSSYFGQPPTTYVAQSNSGVIYYYGNHPIGSQMDFQMEAILQNRTKIFINNLLPGFPAVFQQNNYGYQDIWVPIASSDWSNTQTITIPETSSSASPNPTPNGTQNPTPTVPEFSLWTILLLLTLIVASAGLLVYHKKS